MGKYINRNNFHGLRLSRVSASDVVDVVETDWVGRIDILFTSKQLDLVLTSAQMRTSCRLKTYRKLSIYNFNCIHLQNIGFDTAENEPSHGIYSDIFPSPRF